MKITILFSIAIAGMLMPGYQPIARAAEAGLISPGKKDRAGELALSHCANASLSEVKSISNLPADIQLLLVGKKPPPEEDLEFGTSAIADRGEEFDAGCFVRKGIAHRRFALAGIRTHSINRDLMHFHQKRCWQGVRRVS